MDAPDFYSGLFVFIYAGKHEGNAAGLQNQQEIVRSYLPVQNVDIAQLVEHQTENLGVTGSIPVIYTNDSIANIWVRCWSAKPV